jgi:hypothetical protein
MRSANAFLLLSLAAVGLGCPQSQAAAGASSGSSAAASSASASSGSGSGSGSATSPGTTASTSTGSTASTSASTSTSATAASSGTASTSSSSSGSPGGLTWSQRATPTGMSGAESIWGGSVTDFYIGDADGALFHYNGSAFASGFHDPANMPITSIYESPSGKVYLAGSSLFSCNSQCTTNTNFTSPTSSQQLGCIVTAVCGNGETVYAIGNQGTGTSSGPTGCLLTTDGLGNWASLTLSSLPAGAVACAVAPDGTAFIGGAGGIVSYSSNQGATAETINWPGGPSGNDVYVTFQALWSNGSDTFAAGGNRRVFQRTSSGWTPVLNNSAIDQTSDGASSASFAALAGAAGGAWAFGDDLGNHQTAFFDGTTWSYLPTSIVPQGYLWAAWAADAANYFVVGSSDGLQPLIMYGHH